ncbi:MAG: GNAT family N-acetyltransferase, partial [Paracoccaceae bacterium]
MTPAALTTLIDATWPPARQFRTGPWTIREGQGGGQRVSAATADADWNPADIPQAEAAMRALNQSPLVLIRASDTALDAALAARGYALHDPVTAYAIPAA